MEMRGKNQPELGKNSSEVNLSTIKLIDITKKYGNLALAWK
jgi:hypothetical protein